MRQLITTDKSGHIVGEFPRDPLAGFENGRHGIRRRLISAKEAANHTPEYLMRLAQDRYDLERKRLYEAAFIENEKEKQKEYRLKRISFSEASAMWLKHVRITGRTRTINAYSQTIKLYLDTVGDHELREFSRDHNLRFYDALQKTKAWGRGGKLISADTQNAHMRQLNNFLRWAYDSELMDKTHRLKKAPIPVKEMEVFSLDQIEQLKAHLEQKLANAAKGRPEVNARNLLRAFMLATQCLLRKGAIAALPLENIDLEAGVIRIRDVPALGWKNKANRWPNKPISNSLREFLKADLAARNKTERYYLDDGHGNTWYSGDNLVSKAMKKACREIGLPEQVKPFHWGMRAALITYLLNKGCSPQMVQQLADHADVQTTMRYYNTREANQKQLVDQLPDF